MIFCSWWKHTNIWIWSEWKRHDIFQFYLIWSCWWKIDRIDRSTFCFRFDILLLLKQFETGGMQLFILRRTRTIIISIKLIWDCSIINRLYIFRPRFRTLMRRLLITDMYIVSKDVFILFWLSRFFDYLAIFIFKTFLMFGNLLAHMSIDIGLQLQPRHISLQILIGHFRLYFILFISSTTTTQ